MTVLQILGIHPYKLGGFEEYIMTFAKRMHESGHKTLFVFAGEPHPFLRQKLIELDCEYFIQENPKGLYGFLSFLYRLINMIRKNSVDIVQGQFHPHSHYAVLAAFLTGTPAFRTIRSTTSQTDRAVRFSTIIKANISSFLSRSTFVVSNSVMRDYVDNLHVSRRRIQVLHNGVNLGKYNPGANNYSLHRELKIREDTRIILAVAHARPEKGLEYLVKAVPDIINKYPDTQFVFSGGGPLESELINLARELSILKYVHFLGVRDDVPNLLNCSYLSVLPALAEPLGNVVLEAMAMKKAVVATMVDGNPEMVEHGVTGLLVPPGDSSSLSASIISLLDDPEKAAEMGRAGRERVENYFDLDKRVLREIQIYENLLNG